MLNSGEEDRAVTQVSVLLNLVRRTEAARAGEIERVSHSRHAPRRRRQHRTTGFKGRRAGVSLYAFPPQMARPRLSVATVGKGRGTNRSVAGKPLAA